MIHDLLIAKLHVLNLDMNASYLIFDYLTERKQRVKVNSSIKLIFGYILRCPARINSRTAVIQSIQSIQSYLLRYWYLELHR